MADSKVPVAKKRRSVNLTIPENIIKSAKALNLNVSEAAEAGIRRAIAEAQAERWLAENNTAIAAHNARVEKDGMLLTPEWAED